MIDLTNVKTTLDQARVLIARLDGGALDDRDALTDQTKGDLRRERAQRSRDLQLLATRLELAAALIRNEYWYARGEPDPLRPGRADRVDRAARAATNAD